MGVGPQPRPDAAAAQAGVTNDPGIRYKAISP
jgi:hypothetical protein